MHNESKFELRCCSICRSNYSEFTQTVNLKKTGLTIYIYDDEKQKKTNENCSVILYNTGEREIKKLDYIIELCRYKANCLRCTTIIQRIRSILDDITSIKKHQIIGICQYCRQPNTRNKCKRCEYIANKFIRNKVQECKRIEQHFRTWICKVEKHLISIVQGQLICKHNIWMDYKCKIQLDSLLQHFKSSLPVRQCNIEVYPDRLCLQSSANSIVTKKMILEELLFKFKSDNKIDNNIIEDLPYSPCKSESTCICKPLNKDNSLETPAQVMKVKSITQNKQRKNEVQSFNKIKPYTLPLIKETEAQQRNTKEAIKKPKSDKSNKAKNDNEAKTYIKHMAEDQTDVAKQDKIKEVTVKQVTNILENQNDKAMQHGMDHINKKQKLSKYHLAQSLPQCTTASKNEKNIIDANKKNSSSNQLLLKLILERKNENIRKENYIKPENIQTRPTIEDLPIINTQIKSGVHKEDSASTMECGDVREEVSEMIKGNKIVEYESLHNDSSNIKKRPLFEIFSNCTKPLQSRQSNESLLDGGKTSTELNEGDAKVIFYKLSDRTFVEKGWTKLPTTKIMRKMFIYKMLPCNNEFDWFRNQKENMLFYHSGRKSAEVFENGCGKWFYENGDIALDSYNDLMFGKIYKIYSSSLDKIYLNEKKPTTVLGCFDSSGNGVVYNYSGHIRLKYNQSEGVLIDKSIGPPGRWKWHTLNDPPILKRVFLDTAVKQSPCLQSVLTKSYNYDEKKIKTGTYEAMIAIENENFLKEKSKRMLQKYKPFEIRMKVLKLNDYFSLRIIKQSKIYLLFKCGHYYFKQNLGIIIKSDEIIDTITADFDEVPTPYDRSITK